MEKKKQIVEMLAELLYSRLEEPTLPDKKLPWSRDLNSHVSMDCRRQASVFLDEAFPPLPDVIDALCEAYKSHPNKTLRTVFDEARIAAWDTMDDDAMAILFRRYAKPPSERSVLINALHALDTLDGDRPKEEFVALMEEVVAASRRLLQKHPPIG